MRFGALRTIARILKFFAWAIIVVGGLVTIILSASTCIGGRAPGIDVPGIAGGIVVFVVGVLYTLLMSLPLLAAAELIHVMLSIEESTRTSSECLQGIRFSLSRAPLSPAPQEERPKPAAEPEFERAREIWAAWDDRVERSEPATEPEFAAPAVDGGFCVECGSSFSAGAARCPSCGASVV